MDSFLGSDLKSSWRRDSMSADASLKSQSESETNRSYQATPAFTKEIEPDNSMLYPCRISLSSENLDEVAEISAI